MGMLFLLSLTHFVMINLVVLFEVSTSLFLPLFCFSVMKFLSLLVIVLSNRWHTQSYCDKRHKKKQSSHHFETCEWILGLLKENIPWNAHVVIEFSIKHENFGNFLYLCSLLYLKFVNKVTYLVLQVPSLPDPIDIMILHYVNQKQTGGLMLVIIIMNV